MPFSRSAGYAVLPSTRPVRVRLDNGTELTSHAFVDWAKERRIDLQFVAPGKPNRNAYSARSNRTHCDEVLDCYLFDSIEQVQDIRDRWLLLYNEKRPRDSLVREMPEGQTFRATETRQR